MPRPPSENPARGFRGRGPVQLPAEGRKGDPPDWPDLVAPNKAEADVWERVWKTPQATMWERGGWTDIVARYCRILAKCQTKTPGASLLGQAVVLEDRLGLSPKAMRLLMWQIVADEVTAKRSSRSADIRKTIKAVEAS